MPTADGDRPSTCHRTRTPRARCSTRCVRWGCRHPTPHYGAAWPVEYPFPADERLAVLYLLGVRAFPTLPYPHKPGMAAWLNEWSAEFARARPQVLSSATFYPEPEAATYYYKDLR